MAIPEKADELYKSIKLVIENSRQTVYRLANATMVQSYWHIGKLIIEEEQKRRERAEYGKELISNLSGKLSVDFGKGFTETNLKYMRQFYLAFENSHALRDELSWTHYRLLLKVEHEAARTFYAAEAIAGNWSTRTLERQINSLYYNRLKLTNQENKQLVKQEAENKKEEVEPKDIIKDPYVLEFLGLKPNTAFYERELEQAISNKLQEFLLELGKGFCFVGRQHRISAEHEHFFVDLVFDNYILKCFLLIDLKTGKLTHQDIGQMDMYVRYFEDQVRQENDNPTIGLILCAEKNHALAKYSLLNDSKHIFASKYKIYLPTEEELQTEIGREMELVEQEKQLKADLDNL